MTNRVMLLAIVGALATLQVAATQATACDADVYPEDVAASRPSLVVLGTVVSAPESSDVNAGEDLVLDIEEVIYGQADLARTTFENRFTEPCRSTFRSLDDGDRVVIAFDAWRPTIGIHISPFWRIGGDDTVDPGSAFPPEPPNLAALRSAFAGLPATATAPAVETAVGRSGASHALVLTLVAVAAAASAIGLSRRVRRGMG